MSSDKTKGTPTSDPADDRALPPAIARARWLLLIAIAYLVVFGSRGRLEIWPHYMFLSAILVSNVVVAWMGKRLERWPQLLEVVTVADVLAVAEEPIDRKTAIDRSLALGKQYRLQNRIAAEESVSKVLFESAHQLAGNRGLLDEECTADEIRGFGDEIRDVLRRIAVIDSLASRRWAEQ